MLDLSNYIKDEKIYTSKVDESELVYAALDFADAEEDFVKTSIEIAVLDRTITALNELAEIEKERVAKGYNDSSSDIDPVVVAMNSISTITGIDTRVISAAYAESGSEKKDGLLKRLWEGIKKLLAKIKAALVKAGQFFMGLFESKESPAEKVKEAAEKIPEKAKEEEKPIEEEPHVEKIAKRLTILAYANVGNERRLNGAVLNAFLRLQRNMIQNLTNLLSAMPGLIDVMNDAISRAINNAGTNQSITDEDILELIITAVDRVNGFYEAANFMNVRSHGYLNDDGINFIRDFVDMITDKYEGGIFRFTHISLTNESYTGLAMIYYNGAIHMKKVEVKGSYDALRRRFRHFATLTRAAADALADTLRDIRTTVKNAYNEAEKFNGDKLLKKLESVLSAGDIDKSVIQLVAILNAGSGNRDIERRARELSIRDFAVNISKPIFTDLASAIASGLNATAKAVAKSPVVDFVNAMAKIDLEG